jgi:type II secretory pathway predicted ATPase ExeA
MTETLQSHYGFTVMPFTAAVPVPGLFGSAAHKEAVARLRWLISARGLGVLTGEVGSGKTVAVRAAADGLDASRTTLIYLANPQIGTRGIHGAVAAALGQAPRFHHATLIPQVEAALAAEADERNRHVLLALDEAHLLTHEQLEAVRTLTNSDFDSRSR